MKRGFFVFASLIILVLSSITPVFAHASLARSNPAANASLDTPPAEIRLWFSESLEADFSRFNLRDSSGSVISTLQGVRDPNDQTQMMMQTGALPKGLYTVSWRVLSTDGHATEGSFAFGIGTVVNTGEAAPSLSETIPVESVLVRWINLLSLSLGVGSLAFWIFVWEPAVPQGQPETVRWMERVVWLGWAMTGVSGVLMLLLQAATAGGSSIAEVVTQPILWTVLEESRYGQLWMLRMFLWVGAGSTLLLAWIDRWFHNIALIFGILLLATNSLYSHASSLQEATFPAVLGDWLHLIATALWVGGLIQLFVVMMVLKIKSGAIRIPLHDLVGYFSNFMRVSVAALIISGFYAAYLQVGSTAALLTTVYGQTLLVKLLLAIPLLGISAFNLIFTQRHLQNGEGVWTGRLRGFVGAEITLVAAILASVGVMTAIAPARTVVAARSPASSSTAFLSYFRMQQTENLMAHFEITPGYVGVNTFKVSLYDVKGNPLTDAARIRLRFDSEQQNIGQSDLRAERQPDGSYTVNGANLSIAGKWRIRLTIQRTGEFDSLIDFEPRITPAPEPLPPINEGGAAGVWMPTLIAGLIFLVFGGFFAGQYGLRSLKGTTLGAVSLIMVGMLFLISVIDMLMPAS